MIRECVYSGKCGIWVVHVTVLLVHEAPRDNDSERRNLIFQLDYEAKPPSLKSQRIQHRRITPVFKHLLRVLYTTWPVPRSASSLSLLPHAL